MNPARSNKWKSISPVPSQAGLNLAFLHLITTIVSSWSAPPLDRYLHVEHQREIILKLRPSIL